MIYKTTLPFLRLSTSSSILEDENGSTVGSMQRYYSNKKQKLMNYLFDNMVNNVHAYDEYNNLIVDIKEINTMKTLVTEKWHVQIGEDQFVCEKKTKIKTNPQFLYKKHNAEIWIKKDFADKTVRFTLNGQIIAEAVPDGLIPPKSNHITFKIFDSRFEVHEIASLYYVFSLKNS
ncbi:hypothetical protein [Paenibacillus sp. FSL H8-0537]|uniref:tubby C-terminal domain-like protein n=1 Tax=Paenibacillus sp. FSL H8-0537 TaxID=2921399 RepID=UPI0031015721